MRLNRIMIFTTFIVMLLVMSGTSESQRKVYIIPVSGDVEPGMAAYIERALKVSNDKESLVIIEMDTFGGRVDSALKIVDSLVEIPKGKTIAFVSNKAISAGALIALACNEIAMKHNTTIGDCAPIMYSDEGPQILGEKFQSPLRAKFRSLAKRNGYPESLAESMVTMDMEVYEIIIDGKIRYMDSNEYNDLKEAEKNKITSKKTVVSKGELLTMDDVEAQRLGFSRMSVSDIDGMLHNMGILNYDAIRVDEIWSETLVRLINKIAPILMLIGIAALYIEIKTPGFGVPGLIGIICLGLVFLNQYFVGLANYTELLIIIAGIMLLGIEIFVLPGFGITGITGIICIILGLILALQDFVIPNPELPWEGEILANNVIHVLGSFVGAFFISLLFLRYVMPIISSVVPGPYLSATLINAHADSSAVAGVKIGDKGVAITFLRPSGKAKIGSEIYDVITQGEFVEKGTQIFISEIKGNRIIVSELSPLAPLSFPKRGGFGG